MSCHEGISSHILRRIIRHPGDKGNLVALSRTAIGIVLDIKNGIAPADALLALFVLALGGHELLPELGVVRVCGRLLDDYLLPVVADLEDDPLELLFQLEVVEGGDALGCDRDARKGVLSEALRKVLRRGLWWWW